MKKQNQSKNELKFWDSIFKFMFKWFLHFAAFILGILKNHTGNGKLGIIVRTLYWMTIMAGAVISLTPQSVLDYISETAVIGSFFLSFLTGAKAVAQFIGLGILFYMTDLPDSAGKLLKALPSGTPIEGVKCISLNPKTFGEELNVMVDHNIKDSDVIRRVKESKDWVLAPKENGSNLWTRPLLDGEDQDQHIGRTYKDYLRYAAYTIGALLFTFLMLVIFLPVPENINEGADGNQAGAPDLGHGGEAILPDGVEANGEASIFGGLTVTSRLVRAYTKLKSLLGYKNSTPSPRIVPPTDSEIGLDPSDFSHFFRIETRKVLENPVRSRADLADRAAHLQELETSALHIDGFEFKRDQYGIWQYWIPFDGQQRILWEQAPGRDFRQYKIDPITGHDIFDDSGILRHGYDSSELSMYNRHPASILDNNDTPPVYNINAVMLGGRDAPIDDFQDSQGNTFPSISPASLPEDTSVDNHLHSLSPLPFNNYLGLGLNTPRPSSAQLPTNIVPAEAVQPTPVLDISIDD